MFRTALISLFITSTALATTWTVDDDGKADFDNIQAAVDAASDGDEIIVMPGSYNNGGAQVVDTLGKAIWLHSNEGAEVTIINAQYFHRGIVCVSGEDSKTRIEGFTIVNGYTEGENGAGAYILDSSPTITDCVFENNYSNNGNGGGMCSSSGSNPTLTNCTFENNTAYRGGGMYNYNSSPTITNCTFTGNTAGSEGGGMYNNYYSSPTLTNCIFRLHIHRQHCHLPRRWDVQQQQQPHADRLHI